MKPEYRAELKALFNKGSFLIDPGAAFVRIEVINTFNQYHTSSRIVRLLDLQDRRYVVTKSNDGKLCIRFMDCVFDRHIWYWQGVSIKETLNYRRKKKVEYQGGSWVTIWKAQKRYYRKGTIPG
jgi:hypothetical protein